MFLFCSINLRNNKIKVKTQTAVNERIYMNDTLFVMNGMI